MVRFIRLTNLILNSSHISKIVRKPNAYLIHMTNRKVDEHNIFNDRNCNDRKVSSYEEIEICSCKQPLDYKIMTEWIKQIHFLKPKKK